MISNRSGGVLIAKWSDYNATTREALRQSLTPFSGRVFFTDVGVGGSEWYSDGTRWRAVGGQVVLKSPLGGVAKPTLSNTATASNVAASLMDSFLLKGGLFQIGDVLKIRIALTKAASTNNKNILFRLGTTADATTASSLQGSATLSVQNGSANTNLRALLEYRAESLTSVSSNLAQFVYYDTQGTATAETLATVPSLSNDLYLCLCYWTSSVGDNTVNPTLQDYTITLKTCG